MRAKKTCILLVLVFCLSLLSLNVIADSTYNQTGGDNGQFNLGRGIFNANLDPTTDVSVFAKAITTPRQHPLVADLDGDGTNEIIVLGDDFITLFNNKELDVVTNGILDIGEETRYSNMIVFDIDGNDSFTEIIIIKERESKLLILEYNGSELHNQTEIDLPSFLSVTSGTNAGEFQINCEAANKCLMTYTNRSASGFTPGSVNGQFISVFAAYFNSTFVGHEISVKDGVSNTGEHYCSPKIKKIQVADAVALGTTSYVFTWMEVNTGTNEEINVFYTTLQSNNSITIQQQVDLSPGNLISATSSFTTRCDDSNGNINAGTLAQNYFTAPLTFDFKDTSSGLETVVGFNINTDEYIMQLIEADGDTPLGDRHPQTFDAEGNIIGNVMLSNVFTDTGEVDFCILGHDLDNSNGPELNLLCGSKKTASTPETREYMRFITEGFNVSEAYGSYTTLAHMGQHSNALSDGSDLTEVINSYGVFTVDDDSCNIFGVCSLSRIFLANLGDASLLSVDVEQVGSEDLIALTSTNIHYLDDQLSNEPGTITSVTFNPCVVDSILQVNTTLQIGVIVTDNNPSSLDQDLVQSRVTIYDNNPRSEQQNSSNVSSGSLVQFSFVVNETGTSRTITIEGNDVANPNTIDSITQTFTVATNGVEFGSGSCTTSFIINDTALAGQANIAQTDLTNNAIKDGIQELFDLTTLGGDAIWLIIMFAIAIGAWFRGKPETPQVTLAVVIILEILMLVMGTLFGILNTGIVLSIVIIGLVISGIGIMKIIHPANTR